MKNNDNTDDQTRKEGIENQKFTEIMTTQEVANLLRIHRSTVTRLTKSGSIRSYRVGNRRLYKKIDVLLFFENQVDLQCISYEKEV